MGRVYGVFVGEDEGDDEREGEARERTRVKVLSDLQKGIDVNRQRLSVLREKRRTQSPNQ